MVGFLVTLLWILFVLSSIVIITVVLLQEGKGGGLAEAFGGMGAETFGVKAKGITVFTFIVAAVFVVSSIGINLLTSGTSGPFSGQPLQAPLESGQEAGTAPGGAGGAPDASPGAGSQGTSPAPASPAGEESAPSGGGGA